MTIIFLGTFSSEDICNDDNNELGFIFQCDFNLCLCYKLFLKFILCVFFLVRICKMLTEQYSIMCVMYTCTCV